MKKKHVLIILGILLLIIVSMFLCCRYQKQQNEKINKALLEQVQADLNKANTLRDSSTVFGSFKTIIMLPPYSKQINSETKHFIIEMDSILKIKIAEIENEDKALRKATEENTKEAYEEYLYDYPNGRYVKEATKLLDILEEKAWNEAEARSTKESYRYYLKIYPNGKYVGQAIELIATPTPDKDESKESFASLSSSNSSNERLEFILLRLNCIKQQAWGKNWSDEITIKVNGQFLVEEYSMQTTDVLTLEGKMEPISIEPSTLINVAVFEVDELKKDRIIKLSISGKDAKRGIFTQPDENLLEGGDYILTYEIRKVE